jgi:MFS family permease
MDVSLSLRRRRDALSVRAGRLARVRRFPALPGCLVVAHLILKAFLFLRVRHVPFHGDEVAYSAASRALADAIRAAVSSSAVDVNTLDHAVVGYGWFMPGMPLVLMPLYLVSPDAGPAAARIYVGFITTVIFFAVVLLTGRTIGRRFAVVLLVFPGLVPMWILFSFSLWADLLGGLMVALLLLWLMGAARALAEHRSPSIAQGAGFGGLAVFALYLRSSVLPLVIGLLALALLAVVWTLRGAARRRALASWTVACAVFGIVLAPWSIAASNSLGGRVVTTTTVPLSLAVAFGNPQELCFGPCPGRNIWVDAVSYSQTLAAKTGVGELQVQKEMSDYSLRHLTPQRYASGVLRDMKEYLLRPAGFEPDFRPPDHPSGAASTLIDATSSAVYFVFLILTAISLLLVHKGPRDRQVLSLLVKLMLGALLVQPFVHPCSPRYWPVFAPLMGLAAATLLMRKSAEHGPFWLNVAQSAVAAGWVIGAAGLVVVAH